MAVTPAFPAVTGMGRIRRAAVAAVALAGAAVVVLAGGAGQATAAPSQATGPVALQALGPPSLFTWGRDIEGDLGHGVSGPLLGGPVLVTTIPLSVSLPGSIRQVSADGFNGAAALADGRVATWGLNLTGQIGDGTTTNRLTPVIVPGLSGITQVAAGSHMLALDSAGKVWSWGNNYYGQLGNGTTSQLPVSNPTPVPVPGLTGVVQIAAGVNDSFALRSDGTVWAWGSNNVGQLGDGTTTDRDVPTRVPGVTGVKGIAAGSLTTFAIRADGSLLAWGDNSHGLLGTGTAGGQAGPALVPGLTGVTQMSANRDEALAVAGASASVWAWGDGLAGDGTTSPHYWPAPNGLTGVSWVSVGEDGTNAAVLTNGSVMTWGLNPYGELGVGTQDSNVHPSPVLIRTLAGASQVMAGIYDVMVIASLAPRVPSVIGYSQSEAAAALQSAGYVLGRVAFVVDLTCEYIDEVKSQTPAASTLDPPGTSVNIAIGKVGGKCL